MPFGRENRRKVFVVKIFLFFLSISASLVIVELSIRWLSKNNYAVSQYSYNSERVTNFDKIDNLKDLMLASGCSLEPGSIWNNSFVVNSKGFLNMETDYKKPNGVYRIVGLGDSFFTGVVPYQNNFLRYLENELKTNQHRHDSYEVINLGVSCVGPDFYNKVYQIEGKHYNPDLVLMGFFVGNDWTDDSKELFKRLKHESGFNKKENFLQSVERYSYILSILKNLYQAYSQKGIYNLLAKKSNQEITTLGVAIDVGDDIYINDALPTFPVKEYLNIEYDRLWVFSKNYSEGISMIDFQRSIKNILEVNQAVLDNGASLVVVIIPDEMQTNRKLLEKVIGSHGVAIADVDLYRPQKILKSQLEKNRISYIDLLEEFEKMDSTDDLYRPRDTHFNIKGNEVAGRILYNYLIEHSYY